MCKLDFSEIWCIWLLKKTVSIKSKMYMLQKLCPDCTIPELNLL